MLKIVTIIGARPQFIKASSLSRELKKCKGVKEVIIHTGQHFDNNMSEVFFEQMHIPKPDYYLGIGGKKQGEMTGQMIEKIEEVLIHEKPDCIVVYGDTNSTLAGALAAKKLNIKIAHIEAGLRSFNQLMPEETNRILTDRISDYLFCPTKNAVDNLSNEGFESFPCEVIEVGDIMKDSSLYYKSFAKKPDIDIKDDFILVTIHRAENTNDKTRFKNIIEALEEINKTSQIIVPLHPRSKILLDEMGIKTGFLTIDPVGYLEMLWLIENCQLIMTDSGGLQKEAYFFKKFCITLRDETEWVELVQSGYNCLVGANKEKIINSYNTYNKSLLFNNILYGNGKTSEIIVNKLLELNKK